jgi:hypothetical protein
MIGGTGARTRALRVFGPDSGGSVLHLDPALLGTMEWHGSTPS